MEVDLEQCREIFRPANLEKGASNHRDPANEFVDGHSVRQKHGSDPGKQPRFGPVRRPVGSHPLDIGRLRRQIRSQRERRHQPGGSCPRVDQGRLPRQPKLA